MNVRILALLAAAFAIVVSLAGGRLPFGVVLAIGVVLAVAIVFALVRRR